MLDVEEYLHLALHASSVRDHHACISYLREALQLEPRNARALYLLAAQYAELGLIPRAITGMQTALSIEPDLEIARFQLGLMLLDHQRAPEAKEQFAQISTSADPALRTYAEAMLAIADDDPSTAKTRLTEGLSLPPSNSALAAGMRRLLERLSRQDAAPPAPERQSSTHASEPQSMFLGAYRQNSG